MNTILSIKGLSKKYGNAYALDGIDIEIQKGDVCAILGPNGAGKTTLLQIICGLVKPTSGSLEVCGEPVKFANKKHLRHIGASFESCNFYNNMSAYQNLLLSAKLSNTNTEEINNVLEQVGLSHTKNLKVSKFSLGMRQRLSIGNAILHKPQLLILDEPTNGLDPQGVMDIRSMISRLQDEGYTIVISSHILSEIEAVCNKAIVLRSGNIIAQEDMANLGRSTAKYVYTVTTTPQINEQQWSIMFPMHKVISHSSEGIVVHMDQNTINDTVLQLSNQGYIVNSFGKFKETLEQRYLKHISDHKEIHV